MLIARSKPKSTFVQLIDEIEIIRTRKMNFYHGKHPEGKRFTQQELNDLACPTYKNYLDGRSQRLPSRDDLIRVTDYLECSLEERNYLLSIAQYVSEPLIRDTVRIDAAFEQARKFMRDLQFPSILMTRDYRVHTICPNMNRLIGLPALDQIPLSERVLPQLLFQDCLTPHLTAETRQWLKTVCVYHLKYANEGFKDEDWYNGLVQMMKRQSEFASLWRSINLDSVTLDQRDNIPVQVNFPDHAEPIRLHFAKMPVKTISMTSILFLLPSDDAARDVLEVVGCQRSQSSQPAWQTCEQWQNDFEKAG